MQDGKLYENTDKMDVVSLLQGNYDIVFVRNYISIERHKLHFKWERMVNRSEM